MPRPPTEAAEDTGAPLGGAASEARPREGRSRSTMSGAAESRLEGLSAQLRSRLLQRSPHGSPARPEAGREEDTTNAPAWAWCPLHGQQNCRRWLKERWALCQHLTAKHGLSPENAEQLASETFGVAPAEAREADPPRRSRRAVPVKTEPSDEEAAAPPDRRRPSEPMLPPVPPTRRRLDETSQAPSTSSAASTAPAEGAAIALVVGLFSEALNRALPPR